MKRYLWAFIPSILSVAVIGAAMFYFILPRTEQALLHTRKDTIREMTQVVWSVLESYHSQELSGRLSRLEAQERAKMRIRRIRYGKGDKEYFWVLGKDGITKVHPYRPDHEGKNNTNLADAHGKLFLKEAMELAKEQGQGFVTYDWQVYGDTNKVEHKLTYVRLFKPWGWIVGTGVFVEDINRQINAITERFFLVGLGVLMTVLVLSGYISWREFRVSEARAQAEEALRDREETFRALAESSLDTIMRFDRGGRHLYANAAVERQTGIPPAAFLGKTHAEMGFPPDLVEIWEGAIAEVFASGRPGRREFRLPNNIWVDWQLVPEFDDRGEVKAVIGSARDITEYVEAQIQRRKMEQALNRKQKLEAIGTLAGGIAHDFNNILAAITGYAETALLACEQGNIPRAQIINMLEACGRARNLTRQVLTFSRGSDQDGKPVQVSRVVEEVLRLIRASLDPGIDVVARLETEARVSCDEGRLHQLLLNLCTNAGQAMAGRDGRLDVVLADVANGHEEGEEPPPGAPRSWVRLEVRDTGPGMEPEVIDRIFEPFFTTKGKGEGTGLGLAVVREIVDEMKGHIRVTSQPGRGTAFRVLLPVAEGEAAEETVAEAVETAGGSERVLFVDDEAALVEIGREVLQYLGYQVSGATSSLEAWDKFRTDPLAFDLLITDQSMPRLTGTALAERVRSLRPDLPIIICTGKAGLAAGDKTAFAAVDEVLTKPVTLQEMAGAVRRILDARSGDAQANGRRGATGA